MAGIERIEIVSGWSDPFLEINRQLEPAANKLYPQLFAGLGMPLINDEIVRIKCSKDEVMGRYDWKEGIDLILHFADGTKATMQEKYLTYHLSTITFETVKANGQPGAWHYCTAQYYFVGYGRRIAEDDYGFQDWMLIDLPAIHRADAISSLNWGHNGSPRARTRFQYLHFNDVPTHCVVARYGMDPSAP
jgi:hypothetical protein